jgi:hypothetical protein
MRDLRLEIFEPEALARLGSAFDAAWEVVAQRYAHTDVATQAAARADLAMIMLQLAGQQVTAGELKHQAIHQFSGPLSGRLLASPTPTDTEIA